MKTCIVLFLMVVLIAGCRQSQNPRQFTANDFRHITTFMTLQQVIDKFGMYDQVRESGILRYEYDFPDGSAVLVCPEWPFQPSNRIQGVTFCRNTNEIRLHP